MGQYSNKQCLIRQKFVLAQPDAVRNQTETRNTEWDVSSGSRAGHLSALKCLERSIIVLEPFFGYRHIK